MRWKHYPAHFCLGESIISLPDIRREIPHMWMSKINLPIFWLLSVLQGANNGN